MSAATSIEIYTLLDTFLTTRDITSLHSAIQLTESLIASTPSGDAKMATWHSVLATLLAQRPLRTALARRGPIVPSPTPTVLDSSADAIPRRDGYLPSTEFITHIQTLVTTANDGGDVDFLEDAIALTEEVVAANYGSAVLPEFESILSQLLEMRNTHSNPMTAISKALLAGRESISADTILQHIRTLQDTFDSTGEIEYLDDTIAFAERLINGVPADYEHLAAMLSNLGWYLLRRFHQSGALPDLERAIEMSAMAVEHLHQNDERASSIRSVQSLQFFKQFERLGRAEDLEKAITAMENAVENTPAAHPDAAVRWSILSTLFTRGFERFGRLVDLDKAMEALEKVFNGRTPTVEMWSMRAAQYLFRFGRLGLRDDIDHGIRAWENALAGLTPGDNYRALALTAFGFSLSLRFSRYGMLEDVQRGIVACEEAATVPTPKGLAMLAVLLNARFERLGDMQDLERAVEACTQAVSVTPPGHEDRAFTLDVTGKVLTVRFEQFGDLEDLSMAIRAREEVLAATPVEDTDRAFRLDNLSRVLGARYGRLAAELDITNAITASEEAVGLTPEADPALGGRLGQLADMYRIRYDQRGTPEDLRRAIEIGERALQETPIDDPENARRLDQLSGLLHSRFEHFGELDDLANAIRRSEEAVAATPVDHPERAGRLGQLSDWLSSRFNRFGAVNDLLKAIDASKQALAATPPLHICRPSRLHNYSGLLYARFQRLGDADDLTESCRLMGEAAVATPAGDPDNVIRFNGLSICLSALFLQSRDLEHLQRAVQAMENAVVLAPVGHPLRPTMLFNLSDLLSVRFLFLHDIHDRHGALGAIEDAVEATPTDHANRGLFLLRMALLYLLADSNKSLAVALEAWQCPTLQPRLRIVAALLAVPLLLSAMRWVEACLLIADAIKLVPEVSSRLLGRIDQQYLLAKYSPLPADAVAITLQAGLPAWHALSLLELGRGIIMGYSIDCRSDLSDLDALHPQLCSKLNSLRVEIDAPLVPAIYYQLTDEDKRRRRVQAIGEIDETLASIRGLPGFEGFQLAPSSEMLLAMSAEEGPIVIFNTTAMRSDAIIVTAMAIKSLHLPHLDYTEVIERMGALSGLTIGKRSTYVQRNQDLQKILLWLWDAAVEPVLEELGLGPVLEGACIPRIWWVGVGPLAAAPFHAAGDHSSLSSTRNTLSRAISSYIPTLKALSFARQRKLELLSDPVSRILIVTMPTTPDTPAVLETVGTVPTRRCRWSQLPNAELEADGIVAAVSDNRRTVTCLVSPTASHVLECLPGYHAIHFACHGVSDPNNPSNSHLVLHGDPARITVQDISNMNIRNAQIAYLSACSSAQNTSADLPDESIHIASGFQLAGFSHVLGMLWTADDLGCCEVAVEFYRRLFQRGPEDGSDGHAVVSAAYHEAVKMWRAKCLSQPIKWAAFIHTGA